MLNQKYPLNFLFNVHKHIAKSGQKGIIDFTVIKLCSSVKKSPVKYGWKTITLYGILHKSRTT